MKQNEWIEVIDEIPVKWKKKYSSKDGGFVEVPIRFERQKRLRKDNEDGSFELCGIAWHRKHY